MKKVIYLSLALAMILVFSGCKKQLEPKAVSPSESATERKAEPEDQIDFADPGDDEIGQEIQELDNLINQTSPSEYSESGLSDEELSGEAELQ